MFDIFLNMLKGLFEIIKYPLYLALIFIAIFIVCCSFWFLLEIFKGRRLKKGTRKKLKKEGFIYKVFYKLPKQMVEDLFNKEPDFFSHQGCVIFEGRQRCWKNYINDRICNENATRIS